MFFQRNKIVKSQTEWKEEGKAYFVEENIK
jgi:hypothetical protein